MKKTALFIIVILFTQNSFSQIENCSECDTKIFTFQDISHLSLLELKILRNEIFARHQYVFKDDRLSDYFSENYTWYKPDYNSENNIQLNAIEKQNISLFSMYETKKVALQNNIIKELKTLKKALENTDTITSKTYINKVFRNNTSAYSSEMKREIKDLLSVIKIDRINWYNEKGLFKITTDNGEHVNEISVEINENTIILKYADTGYSELLNDDTAFTFGTNYHSENEFQSWYIFKIIDDKLVFIEQQGAG